MTTAVRRSARSAGPSSSRRGRRVRFVTGTALLAGTVLASGVGGCSGGGDGEGARAAEAPVRALPAEGAVSFDVIGDTAVILAGPENARILFVPLRGSGGAVRTVELGPWARHAGEVRAMGDRLYLSVPGAGVAVLDPDGVLRREDEIRRPVPAGFVPGPDGRVYFRASTFEQFAVESAGPRMQSTRPFARSAPVEAPAVSRARSGPGLHPNLLVEGGGRLILFSNRSGMIRTFAPDGSPLASFGLPPDLLSRAVPQTRSAIGQPGRPLASGLHRGCDGEVILTLADREATVVRIFPDESRVEVVGFAGRRARGGPPRIATLCGGVIWWFA
ncbi:MAG: hypothetical protein EA350_00950 [Gemmatimonadales bacterium]|nr:MAG: hypothetical protein EA350_00950 [Gemmatimonadales bacterium]